MILIKPIQVGFIKDNSFIFPITSFIVPAK